jgi:hypothetical protein
MNSRRSDRGGPSRPWRPARLKIWSIYRRERKVHHRGGVLEPPAEDRGAL